MAVQAGELVDRVINRVRDAAAVSATRDRVRRLLTHGQRLVNSKFGLVIEDVPFQTVPWQMVYPVASLAPSALRIVGVQYAQRDLTEVVWREFWFLHRTWLRDVAMEPQSFSLIGRDLLVIYPAQPEPRSVTLRPAIKTADLTSDLTDIEIPAEFHPLLVDIVCAVMLVRMRTYATLGTLSESVKSRMDQA